MKGLNKIKWIAGFLLSLILLAGCKDDGIDGGGDITDALCEYIWTTEYTDYDYGQVYQEYYFNPDGTGGEYYLYTNYGQSTEDEYYFNWYWDPGPYLTVRLNYENGSVLYFDDIYIAGNRLTADINGDTYLFYGTY
ncbi:MAG: hypothetical protein LUH22_12080 [Bacteroides sp.]|nr:hypothetical protein [Bacteroides sp.]